MTINNDWSVLSEFLQPEEYAEARKSGETPLQIWAKRCNKTEEWALTFFQDVNNRKRLAHLNSIKDHEEFRYEGSRGAEMFTLWNEVIQNLPADIVDRIGIHYEELKEGFVPYSEDKLDLSAERLNEGKLVVLESGFSAHSDRMGGHSVYVVFCKGYMLLCNRGYQLDQYKSNATIKAYRMELPQCFSRKALIDNIDRSWRDSNENNLKFLYETLPQDVGASRDSLCERLETLTTGPQKVGNCASANCKEALLGALALLSVHIDLNGKGSITDEALGEAKLVKRAISAHARATELESYYSKHRASIGEVDDLFDRHLVRISLEKAKKQLMKAGVDLARYPAIGELDRLLLRETPIIGTVLKVYDAFCSFLAEKGKT